MDQDLILIFSFIIVVPAVLGMTVNGVVQKVLDYKRTAKGAGPREGYTNLSELEDRTQLVEDRLAVLERIATDRGTLLADEIEQLRLEKDAAQ